MLDFRLGRPETPDAIPVYAKTQLATKIGGNVTI